MSVRNLDEFRAWAERALAGLTYVGPDPHHALGLAELIPSFRAVSSRAPALALLQRSGADVLDVDSPATSDAAALLSLEETASFLDAKPDAPIFVFKPSHAIGEIASSRGWMLLAPDSAVARRWENKLAFPALARDIGVTVPTWTIFDVADDVDAVWRAVAVVAARDHGASGNAAVVQAAHGYAGARTVRVSTSAELARAVRSLRAPRLRVAPFIDGIAWTLNACVTAAGVAVDAPTLQLTGIDYLTPRLMGACGNEGTIRSPATDAMTGFARKIGSELARSGYRGLFGVDYVIDGDGCAWVIEVNPRLVSSVGLATQSSLVRGRVPLLGRHFMSLVDPDADGIDVDETDEPSGASQVVLHNLQAAEQIVGASLAAGAVQQGARAAARGAEQADSRSVTPGGPAASGGPDRREDVDTTRLRIRTDVRGLADLLPEEWLLLPAGEGRARGSGAEVARLQRLGRIVERTLPGNGNRDPDSAENEGKLEVVRPSVETEEVSRDVLNALLLRAVPSEREHRSTPR